MTIETAPEIDHGLEEARGLILEQKATSDLLYKRWFHRETGRVFAWPEESAYRTAILAEGRFERGWRVLRVGPGFAGEVIAVRGGLERPVAPPEMVPEDPRCLAPRCGTSLRVFPLASSRVGGFWHLWSLGWQSKPPQRLRRVYFHVRPGHALKLAAMIAKTAPARKVWAFKSLTGHHDSGRRDCAVLFVPSEEDHHDSWIAHFVDRAALLCAPGSPPYVEPIRPGIGLALDPGDGRSFGEAICAAITAAATEAADPIAFKNRATENIQSLPGMKGKS